MKTVTTSRKRRERRPESRRQSKLLYRTREVVGKNCTIKKLQDPREMKR